MTIVSKLWSPDVYCQCCRTSCCREALFESYVNMLHHHCSEAPGTYSVLQEVLQRAVKEFPNNIYLLTCAAKLQVTAVFFYCYFAKNTFSYITVCSQSGRWYLLPFFKDVVTIEGHHFTELCPWSLCYYSLILCNVIIVIFMIHCGSVFYQAVFTLSFLPFYMYYWHLFTLFISHSSSNGTL
jgi:hypothetical protein